MDFQSLIRKETKDLCKMNERFCFVVYLHLCIANKSTEEETSNEIRSDINENMSVFYSLFDCMHEEMKRNQYLSLFVLDFELARKILYCN